MLYLRIGIHSKILSDEDLMRIFLIRLGRTFQKTDLRLMAITYDRFYKTYLIQKSYHDKGMFFEVPYRIGKTSNAIMLPRYYYYNFLFFGNVYIFSEALDGIFTFRLRTELVTIGRPDLKVTGNRHSIYLGMYKHILAMLGITDKKGFLYLYATDSELKLAAKAVPDFVQYLEWKTGEKDE